jgi:RimJ/RimL family protein N-acetyltransferase
MRPVIETARLVLRELDTADLPAMVELLGDPQVMAFWPRPYTAEEAAGWITRQQDRYARDGCGYWLAVDRASGQPIGQVGIMMMEIDGRREPGLGYILHHRHWGRGLATEAAAASCAWAFESLGAERVVALIQPRNAPSRAVAERLGMVVEGQMLHADLDHLIYAMRRTAHERQ